MSKDLDKLYYNRAETYEFLDRLGAKIWKILPLYEDRNEFLVSYIEGKILKSTVFGGGRFISDEIKYQWFTDVVSGLGAVLTVVEETYELDSKEKTEDVIASLQGLHTELRNSVFTMTNMLNKVKNQLVGGHYV